jgi:hypothetical protein
LGKAPPDARLQIALAFEDGGNVDFKGMRTIVNGCQQAMCPTSSTMIDNPKEGIDKKPAGPCKDWTVYWTGRLVKALRDERLPEKQTAWTGLLTEYLKQNP